MTILHWPSNTGAVQIIEQGCFTGSSSVWITNNMIEVIYSNFYLMQGNPWN